MDHYGTTWGSRTSQAPGIPQAPGIWVQRSRWPVAEPSNYREDGSIIMLIKSPDPIRISAGEESLGGARRIREGRIQNRNLNSPAPSRAAQYAQK